MHIKFVIYWAVHFHFFFGFIIDLAANFHFFGKFINQKNREHIVDHLREHVADYLAEAGLLTAAREKNAA